MVYYEVKISAETQEQAYAILSPLLEQKLVTGGQLIKSPARFLWKGEVANMDYITITSYTIEKHREAIIKSVRSNSDEEVPMITFITIDHLNGELRDWIEATCAS